MGGDRHDPKHRPNVLQLWLWRGAKCHECPHFRKECWNKKADKKVVGYDDSGKKIIEYNSFLACGLINKPFPDTSKPIEGQIMMQMEG